MTLSADLQSRYRTEVDVDWYHAFVLSHPYATTQYLVNHHSPIQGYVDGAVHSFSPVPAQIQLPSRDESGRQDLSISWCGVGLEAKAFLDQAVRAATIPVMCRYSVFINGNTAPQIDPWLELSLTGVTVSEDAVMVVATRADILNRPFPTEVYRLSRFPGLRRQ